MVTDDDMRFDSVVRGGTVVLEDECKTLDVGIRGGLITALAPAGSLLARGGREVDASGCFVLPGGIDTHTHVQWPLKEGSSLDDFESASRAAAVSGTTTLLDFVPPPRSMTHLEAGRRRLEEAADSCAVDYSFRPILVDASAQTLKDIGELARLGMRSFKIFTTYANMRLTDGEIFDVMRTIGDADGLAGFHAENHEVVEHALGKVVAEGTPSVANFPRSRPELAEAAAIDLVALYARKHSLPIYIFHVSGADGVEAVQHARGLGTLVRAETCTHYLVFDSSVYEREDGWMYVITPPIREAREGDILWASLKDRTIDCVGSDHCAYGIRHKRPDLGDFRAMEAGAPGVAARLPMLWARGVATGRISVNDYARITALGPAQTFGLYPRKGSIRLGADADLVIMDPEREWTWPVFDSSGGSDYDPYAGLTGVGLPRLTMLRGDVIAQDGQFCGTGHGGQFLPQRIDASLWADGPGR